MAGMNYQLVVRTGPIPGKIYPIIKDEIVIGRDPNCEVLINDAEVSRHHASVRLQGGGFMLEDLGSTNGTVVNGQKLAGPHFLRPGEIITLGQHVSLVFEAEPVFDPDATMVTPMVNIPLKSTPAPSSAYQGQPVQPSAGTPASGEQIPDLKTTKKSNRLIFIILAVILVLLVICCVSVLIFIDSNSLWCSVAPVIPGCP